MTERRRAVSPVSTYREKNKIQGFIQPPRDYTLKLSPVQQRLVLKKYGYGTSPQKKGENLRNTITERYANSDLLKASNDKANILNQHPDLYDDDDASPATIARRQRERASKVEQEMKVGAEDEYMQGLDLAHFLETSLEDLSQEGGSPSASHGGGKGPSRGVLSGPASPSGSFVNLVLADDYDEVRLYIYVYMCVCVCVCVCVCLHLLPSLPR